MYDSQSEIGRLRKLGVEDEMWDDTIELVRSDIEDDDISCPLVPVVSLLADLQNSIQDFYVDRLSSEIDSRIILLNDLVKEGIDYGFDMDWDKKVLDDLRTRSEEISSLEILEEAVSLTLELEKKIKDLLGDLVKEENGRIREEVDLLTNEGASQKDIMTILNHANRAEVLLESNSERDAYSSIMEAGSEMKNIMDEVNSKNINDIKGRIEDMILSAEKCSIKVKDPKDNLKKCISNKRIDDRERLDSLRKIEKDLWDYYNVEVLSQFDELDTISEDLISRSRKLLPESEIEGIRNRIKEFENSIRAGDIENIPKELKLTTELLENFTKKATESAYLSKCSMIIESCFSMDDDKARSIIKDAQELAESIKNGRSQGVEKEIDRLQSELMQLRSLLQIENIEKMLSDIEDLDDLAKELFSEIDEDDLKKEMDSISKRIKELLDSTSRLYNDPDAELVKGMNDSIEMVKEDIIDLENKWRAMKRLQGLEEMGVYKIEIDDKLLQQDLVNLKILFEKGDHVKFFRVYERVDGQMDKIKRSLRTSISDEDDKAREVLIRGRGPKKTDTKQGRGKRSGMAGIQRLARDMAEKRKMIDQVPAEKAEEKADKKEELKVTPENEQDQEKDDPKGENDIAGIARLIAGDRIKKLEEKGSSSIKGDEAKIEKSKDLPWSKDKNIDMKGLDNIMNEMQGMDREDVENTPKVHAERIKKKLDEFYGKLPDNLQLDESMTHYGRGVAFLQRDDHISSLREFRISISSAVKMTKLHKEITKAMVSIDKELAKRRKVGQDDQKLNRVFNKAEEALGQGRLSDCATLIKVMKKELFEK
jgi:hypothetical protein